ncbi:LysR family transcriptional regulator [Peptoniphilus sp. ING2-D1G]|nr:LysR family transcriptional regulator [Peptoniphilus sp. ING2-D1G]
MDQRLITFLTLCKTMNYRVTAQKLHLTQPAVTKQIQSLERELDTKLFTYEKNKLKRSEDSYTLENYAVSFQFNYESLLHKLKHKGKQTLRIGITKTVGDIVILEPLKKYIENSDDDIELSVDNTDNLFKKLKDNKKDFLIVEGIFDKNAYDHFLYSREFFTGICSIKNKLANKKVNLKQIFDETILIREKGSGNRNLLETELNRCGYNIENFSRTINVSNINIIRELLLENLGITVGYDRIIHKMDDLATFEIEGVSRYHEFNIVSLKNTSGIKKAERFLDLKEK